MGRASEGDVVHFYMTLLTEVGLAGTLLAISKAVTRWEVRTECNGIVTGTENHAVKGLLLTDEDTLLSQNDDEANKNRSRENKSPVGDLTLEARPFL
jgi:hypothetical protein